MKASKQGGGLVKRFIPLILLITVLVSGCGPTRTGKTGGETKVTAMGSTALLPMVKLAAAGYMDDHPDVTVNVSGGGSFTGLTQVSTGGVDIGNSDVEATSDLLQSGLVDHRVAVAPFLIITNPGVGVDNLTREQAVAIFTGRIKNWKQVGGQNLPIIIIHRPKSSGSRATIKRVILKGREFTDQAIIQDSNGLVRSSIAGTPGAIGYVDAAYLDSSVKALKYEGVAFTSEAVVEGRYPVYTFEHMYTKGEAQGAVRDFLEYVLSSGFQDTQVSKLGFIPVSAVKQ